MRVQSGGGFSLAAGKGELVVDRGRGCLLSSC